MPNLSLSSSRVVAEVIDGEAIVLDLSAGVYFATDGVGAAAWSAAVDGWPVHDIVASAQARYQSPSAGHDVRGVLAQFVDAGLLSATECDDAVPSTPIAWPAVYGVPVLERHDDLQDMMQLDPIHDTDPSGWPTRAVDQVT